MIKFNLIVTDGGVGDLICELVPVDWNIKHFPLTEFHVWVPDYLWKFAQHVLPLRTNVHPFSKEKEDFKPYHGTTTQWMTNHTAMRTHAVDYGFHMLSDRHIYDLNQKNYLQIRPDEINIKRFRLPERYVCIVTTAAEQVKMLSAETLNKITDYVRSKEYVPVFLGKEEARCGFKDYKVRARVIEVDYSKGANLVNQTSLLEAAAIISGARAIVGCDSGVIHLAGCTDTHIVAGYTLVDPIHVAPIRKGSQSYKFEAVEPDLDCKNRYFQTYGGFIKEDYRHFPVGKMLSPISRLKNGSKL